MLIVFFVVAVLAALSRRMARAQLYGERKDSSEQVA
jgi:hypothetical protein